MHRIALLVSLLPAVVLVSNQPVIPERTLSIGASSAQIAASCDSFSYVCGVIWPTQGCGCVHASADVARCVKDAKDAGLLLECGQDSYCGIP